MITWMKNVNDYQIAKVQPGIAYKSVVYKKKRVYKQPSNEKSQVTLICNTVCK